MRRKYKNSLSIIDILQMKNLDTSTDIYPLILDDAFIQYDDFRREKALILVKNKIKGQGIIFTCQKIEQKLLEKNKININYIEI